MELNVLSDAEGLLELETKGLAVDGDPMAGGDPLAALLGERGWARRATLSLAGSDYINSSGLAMLLTWHKQFRDAGGRLVLHSVPEHVMESIRLLRMERVFHLADDATTARRLASGAPE
jgi:anti-anti-sigma factor